MNEPPTFAKETYARTIAEGPAAGRNIGAPFLATDPDTGETLTFTLDGTDATSFGIITTSGQLQTKADLDFEEKASYTVMVTATDQGSLSNITTVTITVTNVDETPTVTGDSSINYAENGSRAVADYTAVDPEGSQITWSLSGEDSNDFSISNAGLLTFRSSSPPPDYEAPKDMNSDNEYLVNVLASDNANTASLDVTVTVTDENETPVVAGNSLINYPENGTDSVATYTADDPENSQITWSLSGDDSGDFSVSNAGVLTFSSSSSPPDYETPTDANRDNIYLVTVLASDGANTPSLDVTITVTDENETSVVAGNSLIDYPENGTGPVATYTAADPEDSQITWSLSGDDSRHFSISSAGVLTFNTPARLRDAQRTPARTTCTEWRSGPPTAPTRIRRP